MNWLWIGLGLVGAVVLVAFGFLATALYAMSKDDPYKED